MKFTQSPFTGRRPIYFLRGSSRRTAYIACVFFVIIVVFQWTFKFTPHPVSTESETLVSTTVDNGLQVSAPNNDLTGSNSDDDDTNDVADDDVVTTSSSSRYLPSSPAFDFSNKSLTFQMHNCWQGRWGVKWGFENAGFRITAEQRHNKEDGSPPPTLKIFNVLIMIACNKIHAASTMSRDSRIRDKRLVSSVVGIISPYCLGNGKLIQMKCRRELAQSRGCDFEQLGIQPATYVLSDPAEMKALTALPGSRAWLVKRSGGHGGMGITLFPTTQALLKGLKENERLTQNNMLAQEYVSKPALLSGKYKFDIRTWLLILSVDPLVVFSRDGFGRVAREPYSVNSTNRFAHLTNLDGQGRGRMRTSPPLKTTRRVLANTEEGATKVNSDAQYADDPQTEEDSQGGDGDGGDGAGNPAPDPDEAFIGGNDGTSEEGSTSTISTDTFDSGRYLRSFTDISKQLATSGQGFPPNFMQTKFREQIDHAHVLAALAQFQHKPRVRTNSSRGFFHLFACDSVVEASGKVKLLECNGFPAEVEQNRVEPHVNSWGALAALVLNYYLSPNRLLDQHVPCPVKGCDGAWRSNHNVPPQAKFEMGKYVYGGWRLVFNEREMSMADYNVCKTRS